jgi:hypothetical protein
MRLFFVSFGFAVETGALWNFDQILIVRGAVNFILSGLQFAEDGLHCLRLLGGLRDSE